MNKKAISTVIATSLIVLITVAAVAILWNAVIPMVSKVSPTSDPCLGVTPNVEIVTSCKNLDNTIKLRVRVGDTDAEIISVKAIVYKEDGTATTEIGTLSSSLKRNTEGEVPLSNSFLGAIKLAIAPIVRDGEGTKECKASSQGVVSNCA